MLIAARNAMMAGGGWKNPYVTDGLVAMWDGEWNVAGGVHDPNATSWVDLIGGEVLSGQCVWNADSLYCADKYGGYKYLNGTASKIKNLIESDFAGVTLEVCRKEISRSATNWTWAFINICGMNFRKFGAIGTRLIDTYINRRRVYIDANYPVWQTLAFGLNADGTSPNLIINGTSRQSNKDTAAYAFSNSISITKDTLEQNIYAIRVYRRPPSTDWLAANYAIDKARFGLP